MCAAVAPTTIRNCSDLWDHLSNELKGYSDLEIYINLPITFVPAMITHDITTALGDYFKNSIGSSLLSTSVVVIGNLSASALALIAIPEALLRIVVNTAITLFCTLSDRENPLRGDSLLERAIGPLEGTGSAILGGILEAYQVIV